MKPKVSIITVNYNGITLTSQMIESLRRHVTVPLEIIVVDNGSREDEAAALKASYPEIKAVRSNLNLGFAGGNNLGLPHAEGEYIMLLNNDTEIEDDTLHLLCETLDDDPRIGAVCPKIKFFAAPRNIQFAGYTRLSHITLRNSLIGFGVSDDGRFDAPHDTPYAHGAAMMLRREAIRDAGPMPEIYFLYYEELDWSERITACGYRIAYDPRCTVLHKESATTGQASPLRTFYITRNRLLFGWRNRMGAARFMTIAYQLLVALPKNIMICLRDRRPDLSQAALKGAAAFFGLKHKTSGL